MRALIIVYCDPAPLRGYVWFRDKYKHIKYNRHKDQISDSGNILDGIILNSTSKDGPKENVFEIPDDWNLIGLPYL